MTSIMHREARPEVVTVPLTEAEKQALAWLAKEHGATMRGYVRKLIHDASRGTAPDGRGEGSPHVRPS